MSTNWNTLIEGIVSGVLTGGASAATTVLTLFRDLRKRTASIEEKLGSAIDPKTGLHLSIANVEDSYRKLRKQIDSWDEEPPTWAVRLMNRRVASTSFSMEHISEVEQRLENKLRLLDGRLDTLETDLNKHRREHNDLDTEFVTVESYDADSRKRAAEMAEMQRNLASSNGFLRGVMASLGHLDSDDDDEPRKR